MTAIDRAMTFGKLPHEGYARSSLSIPADEEIVDCVRSRAHAESTTASQAAMDFRLRGLLEVMDAVK